jgi:hypothetical protein
MVCYFQKAQINGYISCSKHNQNQRSSKAVHHRELQVGINLRGQNKIIILTKRRNAMSITEPKGLLPSVFITACLFTLSWTRQIQSTLLQHICLRPILILALHLYLTPPSSFTLLRWHQNIPPNLSPNPIYSPSWRSVLFQISTTIFLNIFELLPIFTDRPLQS